MIKFNITPSLETLEKQDLYVILKIENQKIEDSILLYFQKYVQNIQVLIENHNFSGTYKESIHLYSNHAEDVKSIICLGLGNFDNKKKEEVQDILREVVAYLIKKIEKKNFKNISIIIPLINSLEHKEIVYEAASALLLSHYHFDTYFSNPKKQYSKKEFNITFIAPDEKKNEALDSINRAMTISTAVNQARHWGDMPPTILNPESYAEEVQRIFAEKQNIKTTILNKEDCLKLGMGGIIGVANGSMYEPRLVILEYKTDKADAPTIALIGKGVTFDTGGISIKPSDNMEDMKDDMAGSAAVFATMMAISELKPNVNVIVAAPLVENMPSGTALKPGDIITFYNKKTAEIKNTDAEGRLILADALSYISDIYKPDYIVDLATLTGACVVALGKFYAALMTKSDELSEKLTTAGIKTGDHVWRLPFDDRYKKAIESEVADICNIGKSNYKAGTITAGFFLSNFVPDSIQWAHLDIAGVSMHVPNTSLFRSYGATGFGVRLLTELLMNETFSKGKKSPEANPPAEKIESKEPALKIESLDKPVQNIELNNNLKTEADTIQKIESENKEDIKK